MTKKAVVLLSGGLDSTTTLAIAQSEGYECYCLSFLYGQRHSSELAASNRVADAFAVAEHKTVSLDLSSIGGSALTDTSISVPVDHAEGIPVTYVPARNTVFLSIALGWAEVIGAVDIFLGVNAVDYSGYPDCRLEYIEKFAELAKLATKAGVEGADFKIHTPLIHMTKSQIIQKGVELGVDYGLTVSCYQADNEGRACGQCDSCYYRKQGFLQAGVADPTRYQ